MLYLSKKYIQEFGLIIRGGHALFKFIVYYVKNYLIYCMASIIPIQTNFILVQKSNKFLYNIN